MAKAKSSAIWYLVLGGLVLLVAVILLVALPAGNPPLRRLIQTAALIGYICVFLSTISSAFVRELVRAFGRPFIKLHHIVSVTGIAVLVLHPLLYALQIRSLRGFIPQFASFRIFLTWGGPVAWYLIGVGAVAALLKKTLGRNWRVVHWLNYVAFILATLHALLLGGTFQGNIPLRVVAVAMLVVVIGVFVLRRLPRRPKRRSAGA